MRKFRYQPPSPLLELPVLCALLMVLVMILLAILQP
jgi:hypothetical protein